ncbi:hypothetical protein Tco_0897393, partial [Tanacetum coccineum]
SKMGEVDIDILTMEQYLALTRGNQDLGVNDDTHEHVERVLDNASLFNTLGVTHDTVMLRVLCITLIGAAKRWFDRIPSRIINTWGLLKNAFIQSQQKMNIFNKGLDTTTRQLLDSQGPIPGMTLARALESIQTLADHSQKWYDGSRRTSSDSSDGIAAITSKLDSLGRDMKKLKENVHAIQVGYGIFEGAHLDKDCPLNEEVKRVEEVKDGEFGRSFPNNGRNGGRYRVGPPRYYTCMDNRTPFSERKPSLEELMNKHIEELTRRRNENEEWMKASGNRRYEYKEPECHIKESGDIAIFADNKAPCDETSSNGTNKLHGVSFISDDNVHVSKKKDKGPSGVLPCQLPLKELSLRSFTLPCTIGGLNMYALAPIGIVENVLVKIDKFMFPSDFVVINMLGDPNKTIILATIHARINVFRSEILLRIGEDRIMFDINKNVHHPTIPVEKVYMANYFQEEESFNPLEISDDLFSYDSPLCLEFEKI